jgi:hypothetical protein
MVKVLERAADLRPHVRVRYRRLRGCVPHEFRIRSRRMTNGDGSSRLHAFGHGRSSMPEHLSKAARHEVGTIPERTRACQGQSVRLLLGAHESPD